MGRFTLMQPPEPANDNRDPAAFDAGIPESFRVLVEHLEEFGPPLGGSRRLPPRPNPRPPTPYRP